MLLAFISLGFAVLNSGFKEYYVYPDDGMDQVKVMWKTRNTGNVKRFELERSRNNKEYSTWKKLLVSGPLKDDQKFIEVDFSPMEGWSYYRLKEISKDGEEFLSHVVPVFLGIEKLERGERIVPGSIIDNDRHRMRLTDYDNKVAILVLRDKNGDEYLYDKKIRATNEGLFIEPPHALPKGEYVITASSINELNGLSIKVK